jgi:hypothetical protein
MIQFLKEVDHVFLGLPMLTCAAAGALSGLLQQTPYAPVRAIGWLGCRTAIVLGVVTGIPLLMYSLTKLIFAKFLKVMTFNYFDSLKSFEKHAELQFNITLVTVSTLPLIIFALPHLIQASYKAYQNYHHLQAVYDEFSRSDLYKTLQNLYGQMNQIFYSAPSIDPVENPVI